MPRRRTKTNPDTEQMTADYVVIGAGSAGAAVAFRLSEAGRSVILVEAGGSDAGPFIQMPGALSFPMNMRRYDWGYHTEAEPLLNNRRLACPRGKVVGGSSSINGMVYVRGHAGDYDHWAKMGAKGWDWAHVQPYFKQLENWSSGGWGGDPLLRGQDGPVRVRRGSRHNPLHGAFVAAAREAGFPLTDDYNGAVQEGAGPMDMTVWRGRRWSTARAYLRPALQSSRCRLLQGEAQRILFDGLRAIGAEVDTPRGPMRVHARRELVLSASAINTPLLLMRSGIGPATHLRANGITPRLERPGVGRNLQDHLEVYIQQACLQPITLYSYWSLLGKAFVGARWLLTGTGPGASNQFESGAFLRSHPKRTYPDVQFHFLPIAVRYDGQAIPQGHGYQVHTGPMRSKARGEVRLDGPEGQSIRFNYMSAPDDFAEFRRAIRMARHLLAQPAFAPYRGAEIQPGDAVHSDAALDKFIRAHAESAYHPCGSARMGAADDPLAVADPEGRVIGTNALRIADSSLFPRITYGNLNAPSIMTGEKIAAHMLGRPLPAALQQSPAPSAQ